VFIAFAPSSCIELTRASFWLSEQGPAVITSFSWQGCKETLEDQWVRQEPGFDTPPEDGTVYCAGATDWLPAANQQEALRFVAKDALI
jgi:hypothetical protein